MKTTLPWLQEMATEPTKVQSLIEQRALRDWYSDHSADTRKSKRRSSGFDFLLNEKRRVRKFVGNLSDIERVVVYLRYWENLLEFEISNLVGITETKIEAIIKGAIDKLRLFYVLELSSVQTSSVTA